MTMELTKAMAREKLELDDEVEVMAREVIGATSRAHDAFKEFVGLKYKRNMVRRPKESIERGLCAEKHFFN